MRRALVLVISLVVFAVVNHVADAARTDGLWPVKKTVTITNRLPSKALLRVHCRSKNDDLGIRYLRYDESFHFKFRTDIFFRTLFYCSFEWPGSGRKHWYDIYNDWLDHCKHCKFVVKNYGVCKYNNRTYLYDKCFSWQNEIRH
ncbi:unnamed protein product [Linum tenue]|uniref:S-protein homolog n=1 Tax=Linum tenue TaxID=586396 RepID=A0AAV0RPK5_9ROSI|nr:unnamed protein product [Linum tenue]